MKTYKDPEEFTVDRSKWCRGNKKLDSVTERSCLLTKDGNMCCLGFEAKAAGFTKKELFDKSTPLSLIVNDGTIEWDTALIKKQYLLNYNSKICEKIMTVNDNVKITDPQRESELKILFAKIGMKVKFTGRTNSK